MSVTSERGGRARPGPGAPSAARPPGRHHDEGHAATVPARAAGVELLGELKGSGYRRPPALVRRADGQTIQLTRLLYLVLESIDGRRSYQEIAERVSAAAGRLVTAEDARLLTESKLRPLGVLRLADGSEPVVQKANPLLALRFRYVVSDPEVTRRVTAPFATLFRPFVVAVVLAAFVATTGWVLFEKGLASATHQAFDRPGLLLLVFAVTVLSAGFHEFGHAAACRYGGATPGAMGTGLYLVWPAFYTEVSDSYRLGRGGRVRVDLGGLYFNAMFAVAMFGVWAATGWDALLLIIAAQVLQMIRQLAPFVRFDGYHVLADVTGVPDLYFHIKPVLLGLLPHRWGRPEGKLLKPWARAVVSLWVLLVVPLLLLSLAMMVLALPRVLATGWVSLGRQWDTLGHEWLQGDPAGVGVRILSVLAICLPLLGTVYLLARVLRRTTRSVWRSTRGRPLRRAIAVLVAASLAAGLAWAWWPGGDRYRPIRPDDRGTLLDAFPAAGTSATKAPGLREGQVGATRTIWAASSTPPTRETPRLALVLLPRPGSASGDAAPWVFPFDPPDAPRTGDNQALAVNTRDGSTVYDVAFALVWADGDSVTTRNEAYAFASCTGCRTVAVGFQVVLVIGQAHVVAPQNISAAVNYSCMDCVTYALAQQLVVTLPDGLSEEATRRLDLLWEQVLAFGAHLEDVPLDEVRARLATFESAVLQIVRAETGAVPGASSSAAAQPSPSGTDPATLGDTPTTTPTTQASPTPSGTTAAPTSVATPSSSSSSQTAEPSLSATSSPTQSP